MKKLILLLPLVLFFSACKKDDPKPAQPQPNIYIGGMEGYDGVYSTAKYWKNGVETVIGNGIPSTHAYALAVMGTDVYIVGDEISATGGAKCWKNGSSIAVTDPTNVSLNSIAVDGSDLYFAGDGHKDTNGVAMYWKNGVAIPLTDGSSNANANGIVISGNDVYVVGDEAYGVKYWKNGIPVEITQGDDLAQGISIAVSGSDVYVLGNQNTPDGYLTRCWKNGTPIFSDSEAWMHKVIVVNNDVYICGTIQNKAVYWKNGVPVYLTDGTHLADVKDITAYNNDIYAVGYEYNSMDVKVAKYWKNGVATSFGRVGIDSNEPRAIVVK